MNNIAGKLPISKLESGIYTADRLAESMKYSFKNGKVRGETTYIQQFDRHYSWKKGEVTCVTGYPQHGKTEFMLFMMMLRSVYAGWKWALFSPENMSVDHEDNITAGEIFDTLIHMLHGVGCDPYYTENIMTEHEYDIGISFIAKHFFVIYPDEDHTPDLINEYLILTRKKYKVDGWLKDPFNQLSFDAGNREDQFLRRVLATENKLAKQNKVCNVITAHPSGRPELDQNGLIICPDQYRLSGGTMWNNKMDNILAVNRPYHMVDKSDNRVEIHSMKIKKQKLVGIPGMIESQYDRRSNRYYFNGICPLEQKNKEPDNNVFKQIEVPF